MVFQTLKYCVFASMIDRIRQMNHKETLIGLLVLDALEHILKTHQVQVVRENGL
jgi:hypothetical protein